MDSTKRFSDRVDNYVKYRPHYPIAVLTTLANECGLTPSSVIADVGSGTGILTELFLENGNEVFGVEPNLEMREAGERLLRRHSRFRSVAATAEETTLPDRSVDFVTAGQAFHWFDRDRVGREFRRILRPAGWMAFVWNDRDTESTPFLVAYEQLLKRRSTDYPVVDHKQIDEETVAAFFAGGECRTCVFPNRQEFDLDGLRGRLLSSSYVPLAGQPGHELMLAELTEIFQAHQVLERVAFEYRTILYLGRWQ